MAYRLISIKPVPADLVDELDSIRVEVVYEKPYVGHKGHVGGIQLHLMTVKQTVDGFECGMEEFAKIKRIWLERLPRNSARKLAWWTQLVNQCLKVRDGSPWQEVVTFAAERGFTILDSKAEIAHVDAKP